MSNSIASADSAACSRSAPIKLWSLPVIGFATIVLGFPSGITLAAINWSRMGLMGKARLHLLAGATGALFAVMLVQLIAGKPPLWVVLGVNVIVWLYLSAQLESDVNRFKVLHPNPQDADWLSGSVVALAVGLAFVLSTFVVRYLLVLLGIPLPN